jgi:hypothetical protein
MNMKREQELKIYKNLLIGTINSHYTLRFAQRGKE